MLSKYPEIDEVFVEMYKKGYQDGEEENK